MLTGNSGTGKTVTMTSVEKRLSKEKIWSELSEKDKWYMSYIVKKDKMPTAELLELTGQKKNEFSQYRTRLSEKGLIDISNRGMVAYTLPRFDVFIQQQQFYSI